MQNQFLVGQNIAQSSSFPQEYSYPQGKQQNTMENSTNSDRSNQKIINFGQMADNQEIQGQTNSKDQLDDKEEEDPLQEHKEVFQDVISKNSSVFYLESKKHQECQKSYPQKQGSIFKEITLQTFLGILFEKLRQVKPHLVDSFDFYLEKQKTFYRFMQHVYYSYPNRVAVRTLKNIFLVWELYYPCIKEKLPFNETVSLAMRIAEKIYKSELNTRLHHGECSNELKASLRLVIEAISIIICLIMESYTANPLLPSKETSEKQPSQSQLEAFASEEHLQKMTKTDCSASNG